MKNNYAVRRDARRSAHPFARITILCAFAILAVGCSGAGLGSGMPDPASYRQTDPSEYYLYLPKEYSPDRLWPIFVGIHGSGGSGVDCWNLWQTYADQEGFILLCPSLSEGGDGWMQDSGNAKLLAILNRVFGDYPVYKQVFLAGFSAGGAFVQGFAFLYPQYVFGVSVIAPGLIVTPTREAAGIPFFVIVGDRDDPLTIEGCRQLADMLQASGNAVQYYIVSGSGHEVSDQARQLTLNLYRSRFQ